MQVCVQYFITWQHVKCCRFSKGSLKDLTIVMNAIGNIKNVEEEKKRSFIEALPTSLF